MAEHDSPGNERRVKPQKVHKSDKTWWEMLGRDSKLYDAWRKFCKEHNLPFDTR